MTDHHLEDESVAAKLLRKAEWCIRTAIKSIRHTKLTNRTTGAPYDMTGGFFPIHILFHNTILENTNGCENIKGIFVARVDTIEDKTNHNLLPSRTTLIPKLRFLKIHDVTNVLHNTVKSTCCQDLVLVVVRDRNQQFGVSVVHSRS